MASGNGQATDARSVAAATGLAEVTALLHALLAATRSETVLLAVSDSSRQGLTLDEWPVVGSKRVIAHRTGNGTDGTSIPTTGQLLVPANEARVGMQWTNSGSNAVILYLADQARKGAPAVYLGAGASWDGRFGGVTWAGNVFAVAQVAATTLVGGEF